jgi:hypothetical protein
VKGFDFSIGFWSCSDGIFVFHFTPENLDKSIVEIEKQYSLEVFQVNCTAIPSRPGAVVVV